MSLSAYIETLVVLGDESRLRLCALLRDRELNVTDLVRVTGIAQSRVSTHLGRLRDAGIVRDRKSGTQSFYTLLSDSLPSTVKSFLDEASQAADPILQGDQKRLLELEAERREGRAESVTDELERFRSPGRTWQSLVAGVVGLLDLGDVLDVGSGEASVASMLAPYCRSLTCIDTNPKMIEAATERFSKLKHVKAQVADVHHLPFEDQTFDAVILFHTLTYAEHPARAIKECARVVRPRGRIVVLCLDEHQQLDLTSRYGEIHPGFSPRKIRTWLTGAGLTVRTTEIASRESKKPHLQVVFALAEKETAAHALPGAATGAHSGTSPKATALHKTR